MTEALEKWSARMPLEVKPAQQGVRWTAAADPQGGCAVWRALGQSALIRKLRSDTELLNVVKGTAPDAGLRALYFEVGETRTLVGAFSLEAKDFPSATSHFVTALQDFDHVEAAFDVKTEAQKLLDQARKGGGNQ